MKSKEISRLRSNGQKSRTPRRPWRARVLGCALAVAVPGLVLAGSLKDQAGDVTVAAAETNKEPASILTLTFMTDGDFPFKSLDATDWGKQGIKDVGLTLRGTRVICAPSKGLRVFINRPDADQSTPIDDPHYVSSVAFFPGLSGSCDDTTKSTYSINLKNTIGLLSTQGLIKRETPLTVTIVPISPDEVSPSPLVGIDAAELRIRR